MVASMPRQNLVFPDRSRWGEHSPASHAPLSVVIACLTVLLLVLGAYKVGRLVEQRSELGYLVAAAPALEDLTAATRFQDSVSMQYVIRMGRMKRRQ